MTSGAEVLKTGVFPAQAGMNRGPMGPPSAGGSVPRSGGDEPITYGLLFSLVMCSPLRRG